MRTHLVVLGTAALVLASPFVAIGAPATSLSTSVRLLEDTNLFLQEEAPLASGQTQRATPANVHDTAADALASVSLSWKRGPGQTIDLTYSPELVRYFDHASENHTDHTVTGNLACQNGPWTLEAKGRYLHIDGSDEAPIYNALGGTPAIGGEPVRARRSQAIARGSAKLVRRYNGGWTRGVAALFDQQFHTRERTALGYCNYTDRGEATVGVETGLEAGKDLALVAGVRVGRQRQANVLGAPLNFSNTLARYLVGLEGKVGKALKLSVLAGPDVRHYGASARAGFERTQHTAYGEANATWTPDKRDTLALSSKRYLWVASGGRGLYADALVDLTWKRQLSDKWSGSVGYNWHDYDTSHFNAWSPRHDRVYLTTLGVSRVFNAKTRIDLDLLNDRGRSLVANTPGREYTRWTTALTVAHNW